MYSQQMKNSSTVPASSTNSSATKSGGATAKQPAWTHGLNSQPVPGLAPHSHNSASGKGKGGKDNPGLTGSLVEGAEAAEAPTGGTTTTPAKKSVTVNVTFLSGGSTDITNHLKKANEVYKQANVEIKSGTSKTLDEAKSKAILGDDLILEEYSDPKSPTTEEQALIKENRTSGGITMYYVKGMSAGSLGEAFWKSTSQPEGFVYASTTSRTWPHELGHVLLDDGGHPGDADNFMAQTAVASGKEIMTADQIKTIRGNSHVT